METKSMLMLALFVLLGLVVADLISGEIKIGG